GRVNTVTGRPLYGAPFTIGLASGGSTPVGVAIGDLNNDGHPDIVVADQTGGFGGANGNITILMYTGNGTIFNAAAYTGSPATAANTPTGIALGDFNNDGFLDIALAHTRGNGGGNGPRRGVSIVLNGLGNTTPPPSSTPFAGQTSSELETS